jgi:hypothetical protein
VNGSPELFRIGPLTFYTLGTIIAFGFILTCALSVPHARRLRIKRLTLLGAMVWVMAMAIIGGRLIAVWPSKEYYIKNIGEFFLVPEDGLSFAGTLVFGVAALIIYSLINEIPFWVMLDCIAPGTATALVLGMAVLFPDQVGVIRTLIQWLFLTGAYLATFIIWRRRLHTRFIGEISLMLFLSLGLFLLLSSVIFNIGSSLSGWIILGAGALLWFYRKGVSLRLPGEQWKIQYPYRQISIAWLFGYAIIIATLIF